MINKKKIQEALSFYYNEIENEGFEHNFFLDSDSAEKYVCDRAKEKLVDNLEGFELLDINLNDSALGEQEKEVINYIENEL